MRATGRAAAYSNSVVGVPFFEKLPLTAGSISFLSRCVSALSLPISKFQKSAHSCKDDHFSPPYVIILRPTLNHERHWSVEWSPPLRSQPPGSAARAPIPPFLPSRPDRSDARPVQAFAVLIHGLVAEQFLPVFCLGGLLRVGQKRGNFRRPNLRMNGASFIIKTPWLSGLYEDSHIAGCERQILPGGP
jgi:hypothetical protein